METEGIDKVLPTINDIDSGVKLYRQYYTESDEKTNGVIAIEMKLDNEQSKTKSKAIHAGKLQSPYYEYIRDGVKIYELRVYDEKRQKMNVGDEWIFEHNTDKTLPKIRTKITDKKIYKSFEEAIDNTGFEKLLPQVKTKEEAIKIYNAFDNGGYEKNAKIYGVVRFTLLCV
jgi:ASC-1-like (ASCH) protein